MMVLKKGPWSLEEDWKLTAYINTYGIWNWRKMPEAAGLSRCGKSCRLRWMNYLDPQIKRGNFTREEEETIARMHKVLGNKWSEIASALPGRSDNEIKNHWHTRLSKRLKRAKTEQSQASSTTIDDNKIDLAELDRLFPKTDFPDSPFSSSPSGYGSPRGTSNIGTTASVETCATEEKSEASSNPSMICEKNLYWENFQLMFDESGLLHPFGDQFWNPEPTCPFNFYGNLSYNLRESLAQPEDIDEILIDPIFQI